MPGGFGTTGFPISQATWKLLEGLGPGACLLTHGSGGQKDACCFQSPEGEEQDREPQLQRMSRCRSTSQTSGGLKLPTI